MFSENNTSLFSDFRTLLFSGYKLEKELQKHNIIYVYTGKELGGLPDDRSCYDVNGKVIYDRIIEKDFFKEGLQPLVTANSKNIFLAIMCSEAKPEECHRCKLIGNELLLKEKISVKHIIAEEKFKPQELVMSELTKGMGTVNLFGNEIKFTSRESY